MYVSSKAATRISLTIIGAAFSMFIVFAMVSGGRTPSTDEQSVYSNTEAAAAHLSEPVK